MVVTGLAIHLRHGQPVEEVPHQGWLVHVPPSPQDLHHGLVA